MSLSLSPSLISSFNPSGTLSLQQLTSLSCLASFNATLGSADTDATYKECPLPAEEFSSLSFKGRVEDVNRALAGLGYNPGKDRWGGEGLVITVDDQGELLSFCVDLYNLNMCDGCVMDA